MKILLFISKWRIQDFPFGGADSRDPYISKKFVSQNGRIGTLLGACAGGAPLDSTMGVDADLVVQWRIRGLGLPIVVAVVVHPSFPKMTTFICGFWGGWWALFLHGMCAHCVDRDFSFCLTTFFSFLTFYILSYHAKARILTQFCPFAYWVAADWEYPTAFFRYPLER